MEPWQQQKKGSAISRRVITTQSKSFRYFWMFDSLDKSILIWHFRVLIFVAESTWWETFLELWKNKKKIDENLMVKTVGKIRWHSVEEFADLHTRRGAVQDECGSVVDVVDVVSSLSVKIVNPWSISSVPMMIFIHILLNIFTSYYKTMGNACSMQIYANEDHFSNHHYEIIDVSFHQDRSSVFQSGNFSLNHIDSSESTFHLSVIHDVSLPDSLR